ncbi:MAG: tRNA (guanine-N1)-methyltransferase, partial [Bacteroidota bacterium]
MKTLLPLVVISLVFLFHHTNLHGQTEPATQSIDEGSIGDQFDFVIRKSNNYNDSKGQSYEVIRRNLLLTLKTHAVDSIKAIDARLSQSNTTVAAQQNEISTLKSNLSDTQAKLDATIKEKDSMSLLGFPMSKGGYSALMWSIIGALAALMLFFIFRFKNSNAVTKAAKKSLADLEGEFTSHRRSVLEREQKLKRELQDMINKYE